ncbi:type II toxin-antitoxin system YafQ family toxin [Patescibacteria group bacterium]
MEIKYRKNFEKSFKKLSPKLKQKTISAIEQFTKDPHNPQLRNHPLKGSLKGLRAFSITGDVRVIFEEIDNYILVIMLDVGIHNQIY